MYQFTRGMIAFRQAHRILSAEAFYTDAEIHWFSPQGDLPHWADPKEKQLACLIRESEHQALYLMFNASAEADAFHLPPMPNGAARWHLAVDTSHEAPEDVFSAGDEPLLDQSQAYPLTARSSAILVARPPR
jgi:glycogen operon protein